MPDGGEQKKLLYCLHKVHSRREVGEDAHIFIESGTGKGGFERHAGGHQDFARSGQILVFAVHLNSLGDYVVHHGILLDVDGGQGIDEAAELLDIHAVGYAVQVIDGSAFQPRREEAFRLRVGLDQFLQQHAYRVFPVGRYADPFVDIAGAPAIELPELQHRPQLFVKLGLFADLGLLLGGKVAQIAFITQHAERRVSSGVSRRVWWLGLAATCAATQLWG